MKIAHFFAMALLVFGIGITTEASAQRYDGGYGQQVRYDRGDRGDRYDRRDNRRWNNNGRHWDRRDNRRWDRRDHRRWDRHDNRRYGWRGNGRDYCRNTWRNHQSYGRCR